MPTLETYTKKIQSQIHGAFLCCVFLVEFGFKKVAQIHRGTKLEDIIFEVCFPTIGPRSWVVLLCLMATELRLPGL